MPVQFRDADDINALGTAGYLKFVRDPAGGNTRGALFVINARGEPLEFTYNTIDTPNSVLWRQHDIHRYAVRTLTTSIFGATMRTPRVLLCLASEVPHDLFIRELEVATPVCRVAAALQTAIFSPQEIREMVEGEEPQHLFWYPTAPAEGSAERQLISRLTMSGLLLEPFERALVGLREVFGDSQPQVRQAPSPA